MRPAVAGPAVWEDAAHAPFCTMNEYEIIRHPQIEGLSVFFDTVDYRTPHIHPEWELILDVDGVLQVASGAMRQELLPGQMLLLNPRQPHELHKKAESTTFLCLQCSDRLLPGLERLSVEMVLPHTVLPPAEYAALRGEVFELTEQYLTRPAHYELYCAAKAGLILCRLLTVLPCRTLSAAELAMQERSNARLNRLMKFVDEHFRETIRLSDFAAQEGLSLGYMSAFVKKSMNQTFQDYVTSVRFHYACQRIRSEACSLLELCGDAGFSDYRYFSNAFKRYTGCTPEEYRRAGHTELSAPAKVHHSIHSLERFYTREQSLRLLQQYR